MSSLFNVVTDPLDDLFFARLENYYSTDEQPLMDELRLHDIPSPTPHHVLAPDPDRTDSDASEDERRMQEDLDALHGYVMMLKCESCDEAGPSVGMHSLCTYHRVTDPICVACNTGRSLLCGACAAARPVFTERRIPPVPRPPTPPPAIERPDARVVTQHELQRRTLPVPRPPPAPIRPAILTPQRPRIMTTDGEDAILHHAIALAASTMPPPPPPAPFRPSAPAIPNGGKVPRKRKWVADMPLGKIMTVYSVNGGPDITYEHRHVQTSENYDVMMNRLIDYLKYTLHAAPAHAPDTKIRIISAVLTIDPFVLRQL